jgi:outer membrane protein TolC
VFPVDGLIRSSFIIASLNLHLPTEFIALPFGEWDLSLHFMRKFAFLALVFVHAHPPSNAQVLTLKEAIANALTHYGTLKAKSNYLKASGSLVTEAKREAWPDFIVSAQQDYGTINSNFGALSSYRGFSVSSSGPVLASQSWSSAFGGLYLANVNWDFFAFGRARERVKLAESQLVLDASDLGQEKFQQQVRVAAAYLNLLAAQRLVVSQQKNLDRATALRVVVVARAKNGLNPGVDSSLANAEVSNARIVLTNAKDYESEQTSQLAQLMGVTAPAQPYQTDTVFVTKIPIGVYDTAGQVLDNNPLLEYYRQRIGFSEERAKYLHTFSFPTFSLFGIFQGRGSGFDYNYGDTNPYGYSHDYFTGVNPTRSNYIAGIGVTWNLSSPPRVGKLVEAQRYTSRGLKDEYDLVNQNLADQLILSTAKIKNALANYAEAPLQVKAASDAYLQKSVLYKNGLSNIVDVTEALFEVNRAETNRDIAYTNVWQALLLKAAATGDFALFMNAW